MERCRATTRRGQPCRRVVRAGAAVCPQHARAAEHAVEGSFYGARLDADDLRALGEAATLAGVDAELAVMRVLVRKVIAAGDLEAARRAVSTVARLVKIKHDLDAAQATQLTTSLDRVLDTLAAELASEQVHCVDAELASRSAG